LIVSRKKNLAKMQPRKLNLSEVKSLLRQKKVNPDVVRNVLLKSTDKIVLDSVINHFVKNAKKGDVRSKLFLNRLVSKKFNSNIISRERVLGEFRGLAKKGDSLGLRGLLIGVKDPVLTNRFFALWGLRELAERGDARVLPGLLTGVKDFNLANRSWALKGLEALAKKGNASAKNFLEELKN